MPINGREYDFEALEVAKSGEGGLTSIAGHKSFNWKATRDVASADDSGKVPGPWTGGTYRGGEFTLMIRRSEYDAKIAVTEGWMEEIFDMAFHYASKGMPTTTVELRECTITGDGEEVEKGPDGVYVEFPGKFRYHLRNGVAPVTGLEV